MHFTILGSIEAVRDGEQLGVGGPRQRRLLGVLLAHRGGTVSAARLVDAVWPDDDAPEGAARSVLTYVSRLRAALGEGVVLTDPGGYRIDPAAHTVDADEVEALVDEARHAHPDQAVALYDEALARWPEPAFGDLADEWWALATSTRLAEARLVAREERAAALITLGRPEQAIPDLQALVVEHPYRERPVALVMQALDAAGRTADALRAFQDLRARLGEGTGLEPGAEVVAVERAIVGGDGGDLGGGPGPGRPLRGYTLGEVVGEGASGRVYVAVQPGTERQVAIKAIRPDRADSAAFIRRFDAEARRVARLEHPHIVPLYDYWREPGGAYLVFRLLGGGTVRDAVVAGGAWSPERVDDLVEQVGGALMAAHAAGVVHQDVTATNVLLDDEGVAYLTDFGIARDGTGGDGSQPAPKAEERADVGGMARLVWEVLAGERPPVGPLPHLVGRRADLPDGVDAVLARAVAADGYTSVAELVLAWRAAVAGSAEGRARTRSSERAAVEATRREAAERLRRATAAGVNPYRGLRPFDEADAGVFHGRDDEVARLLAELEAAPWVTVVGASGSGKSSLVRAGLVPALRARGQVVVVLTPGEDPVAALRDALALVSPRPLGRRTVASVVRNLTRTVGPVVVVVDQLEECWTRTGADERTAFLSSLAELTGGGLVRVVATVRADLLDRPLQDSAVGRLVSEGAHVLPPLTAAQLDEVIVAPCRRAGITIDEAVVAELVAEATSRPGSLPLLQFALTELYDARVDGRIDERALVALGGMAGAVGRRAEACWVELDDAGQAAAHELFTRLVVLGDDAPATSRRGRRTEVSDAAWAVAERFVAARLLVADHDPVTREPSVEVAHEALLLRWERLAGWIRDDRDWLTRLGQLSGAARAWDDGGRPPADLYRGARLEVVAEALAAGRPAAPVEREFVAAGIDARDVEVRTARRSAQRLRRLLVGVVALLVIAVVAGIVAVDQRRSADDAASAARDAERDAQIEALVGRSESLRATQRDTAALLAVEAFRLADTPRTRSALLASLTDDTGLLDMRRLDGPPFVLGAVLPDGETAIVGGGPRRLTRMDLDTGALGPDLPEVAPGVWSGLLRPSPDGRLLAHVAHAADGESTTIGVIDLEADEVVFEPVELDGYVDSATMSTDGSRLFVALSPSGDMVAIDTATGAEVGRHRPPYPDEGDDPYSGGGVAMAGPERVVLGHVTGLVEVLDPATLEVIDTYQVSPGSVATFRTARDGAAVVGSGPRGIVRIDLEAPEPRWAIDDPTGSCGVVGVVDPADAVFCGDYFGRLVERDLDTGEVRRTLDAQNGNSGSLWAAAGGTELVSFGDQEPNVVRWRLDGAGPITDVIAPGWSIVELSPDGRHAIVGSTDLPGDVASAFDLTTKVISVDTGEDVLDLDGLVAPWWIDDETVAGGLVDGSRVQVELRPLDGGTERVAGELDVPEEVLFEPGRERGLTTTIVGDEDHVRVVDLEGQPIGPALVVRGFVTMSISRSGDLVAFGTLDGVEIRDAATDEVRARIERPDLRGVTLTLSDRVVTSSGGGELTIHDIDTLEPIRTLGGSRGYVQQVDSTLDGSVLAARGGDRQITLYDEATGVRLGLPIGIPADQRGAMSLSLDGSLLAVGGGSDDGIALWHLDPERWVEAACRRAGRDLTEEEWETNIGDLAPYRSTCDLP